MPTSCMLPPLGLCFKIHEHNDYVPDLGCCLTKVACSVPNAFWGIHCLLFHFASVPGTLFLGPLRIACGEPRTPITGPVTTVSGVSWLRVPPGRTRFLFLLEDLAQTFLHALLSSSTLQKAWGLVTTVVLLPLSPLLFQTWGPRLTCHSSGLIGPLTSLALS